MRSVPTWRLQVPLLPPCQRCTPPGSGPGRSRPGPLALQLRKRERSAIAATAAAAQWAGEERSAHLSRCLRSSPGPSPGALALSLEPLGLLLWPGAGWEPIAARSHRTDPRGPANPQLGGASAGCCWPSAAVRQGPLALGRLCLALPKPKHRELHLFWSRADDWVYQGWGMGAEAPFLAEPGSRFNVSVWSLVPRFPLHLQVSVPLTPSPTALIRRRATATLTYSLPAVPAPSASRRVTLSSH